MESIQSMLHVNVIPWTQSEQRCLVTAHPTIKTEGLPHGVTLDHRPLKGKRNIVKIRHLANLRSFTANWPDSNQQEMALPKLACVVSGRADYLLGDYCLHAPEGTFILIPPHAPHHCKGPFLDEEHLQHGECTLLFAYAYSHGIFCWFSRSTHGEHVNDRASNYLIPNVAAVQIFNLVMDEAVADGEQSEAVCKSLLFAFFTMLARDIAAERCMSVIPQEHAQTFTNGDLCKIISRLICTND